MSARNNVNYIKLFAPAGQGGWPYLVDNLYMDFGQRRFWPACPLGGAV